MIISFASLDGINVNEHFGWCKKFYMYEVDETSYNFVKELDSSLEIEAEVDKLEYKIECLRDSDIVCVAQIGPKASNMVQASGIYPLSANGSDIQSVLAKTQSLIRDNPPLWLKRILLK